MLGVANEMNIMVWRFGIWTAGGWVSAIISILYILAAHMSFTKKEDASTSSADKVKAASVFDAVEMEMTSMAVYGLSLAFELYHEQEHWYAG